MPATLIEKAKDLAMRAARGACTQAEHDRRLAICQKCPFVLTDSGRQYCGACGCGRWRLNEITKRCWFADPKTCPRGFWDDPGKIAQLVAARQAPKAASNRPRYRSRVPGWFVRQHMARADAKDE